MESGLGTVGILVGGGPAPGINGVIGAATLAAFTVEAVGLGLRCALRMSEELGVTEPGLGGRVRKLLHDLGLPARYPGSLPARKELASLMRRDKKARAGKLDLILPISPGECLLVTGVEASVAVAALHRELGE